MTSSGFFIANSYVGDQARGRPGPGQTNRVLYGREGLFILAVTDHEYLGGADHDVVAFAVLVVEFRIPGNGPGHTGRQVNLLPRPG